ncbi:hypothetical protein D3C71_1530130 [compost metagenome]
MRGLGVSGKAFAQPQPQAAQPRAMLAAQGKADGPAQQHQQVQAEQAAQGPEHIHRALPVAQGGQCQPCAAEHRQHQQGQQCQAGALFPVAQGGADAVAFGQEQGTGFDTGRQVTACLAGAAVGFLVLQGAGMFLAQAYRFGEPALVQ